MSDALGGLPGAAYELLRVAKVYSIGYVLWGALDDTELEYARAGMASFAEDRTSAMRRRCAAARSSERSAPRRPSSRASLASMGVPLDPGCRDASGLRAAR